MRRASLLFFSLTVLSAVSFGQNTARWELYGGYQLARADIGRVQNLADSLTVPTMLPPINVGRYLTTNGYDISLQENPASWWGGIIDVSGSYGTKNIDLSQVAQALNLVASGTRVSARFQPALYTFAGGPQFTYRKSARIQPFVRIMLGGVHGDLRPDSLTNSALALVAPTVNTKDTALALLGGGGFDYLWKDYVAVRATGDYVRSYLFQETQSNFRISLGISFRIGHK